MGEISEMMLDGFLDSETGEVIDGDSPGYPRTMRNQSSFVNQKEFGCPSCEKRFRTQQGASDHLKDRH